MRAHPAFGPAVALAGALAAAVEDRRDTGVRLLPGQCADKLARFGLGGPAVPTRAVLGYRQLSMIPTLPMNHEIDRVADDLGHDLDNRRPQDMLARLVACAGAMPQRLDITAIRHQPRAFLGRRHCHLCRRHRPEPTLVA